jgi:hypothetical protein
VNLLLDLALSSQNRNQRNMHFYEGSILEDQNEIMKKIMWHDINTLKIRFVYDYIGNSLDNNEFNK